MANKAGPAALVTRLIYGGLGAQAVRAFVELGIADRLDANQPVRADDLGAALELDAVSLDRLLRATTALGLTRMTVDAGCCLTDAGALLRGDASGSLGGLARFLAGEHVAESWLGLADTVRAGHSTFKARLGAATPFELYARDPALAALFDSAMTALSNATGPAVAAAYDFSQSRLCVDVGGGQGCLLAAVLQRHPEPRGLLFEVPAVAAKGRAFLDARGLVERCEVAEGNMFAGVPRGGDVYLMSAVLHDWADQEAVAILRRCREAMETTARLLLVERVLADAPDQTTTDELDALSDLNMMVRTGGRERTRDAWQRLLSKGGFEMREIIPTASPRSVVVAAPD
jgi:O-methyltransferase domain